MALRTPREWILAAVTLGATGVLIAVLVWPAPEEETVDEGTGAGPDGRVAGSQDAAPRRGTYDPALTRDPIDPAVVESPHSPMGKTPSVQGDANPQVAKVVEAATTGTHGERLHLFGKPTALPADAPPDEVREWAATPEPGRALHPAQPGPGVARLALEGPGDFELVQGESVTLSARAVPGAPVSFAAMAGGRFPNQLGTTTVLADEAGIASVEFQATPGVVDEAPVIAASPRCSGRIVFTCFIADPPLPADRPQKGAAEPAPTSDSQE